MLATASGANLYRRRSPSQRRVSIATPPHRAFQPVARPLTLDQDTAIVGEREYAGPVKLAILMLAPASLWLLMIVGAMHAARMFAH